MQIDSMTHGKARAVYGRRSGYDPAKKPKVTDMKLTLKHALAAIILVLSLAAPVTSAPLDDAVPAYQKGDYATALRLIYQRSPAIKQKALGRTLSKTVEQIQGTYDGTFTLSQVPGEHQISLTFQQSGSDVTATYRSALGGGGRGKGTIAGNVITAMTLQSEPNCPGLYTASFEFSGDTVSLTFSGHDCNGAAQGHGVAKKLKFVSPLMSKADELTNNAIALYQVGKYAEAIPVAQQVLAIREKVLGPDHPDVAAVLNSIGLNYDKAGRYAEAELLYKRALAIREKALGSDHPDHYFVAQSLNNLALLYAEQSRYAEAEPLYKRSLAIYEKALGPDHPEVAGSLNNLAALYDNQGRACEAEPLNQRALAIYEKALGPDHPEVAGSLNNLAVLYMSQGRYADALPLVQRAISGGFALKSVALPTKLVGSRYAPATKM
jgi:tetratricopeptide (TPR) repeat protein